MIGLTTKRQLMREVTAAAKAYRWERDEALLRASVAEARADQLVDALVRVSPRSGFEPGMRYAFIVEVEERLAQRLGESGMVQHVAQRIMVALLGLAQDRRGDMREPAAQRMLAP